MRKEVLVICGPTACGKTALGIALARLLDGEIVSADSMQIYRGMDIGTAKPTKEEQALAVHHMIDIVPPSENYSVSRYVEDASACCEDIFARGKLPILVGGTGLYIDSLLSGRDFGENSFDPELRAELNRRYDEEGGEALRRELASFDPERASRLAPADRHRIVRAIEVFRTMGITITEHDRRSREIPPRYTSCRFFLNFRDRSLLYRRIDDRVGQMLKDGLFEEVQRLLDSGISPEATAMQAIGYKEPVAALRGEISREQAADAIRQSSRRYAKRQITWFGHGENKHCIFMDDPGMPDAALRVIRQIRKGVET